MKYVYQELILNKKTKIIIGSSCCPLKKLLLFCSIDVMFVCKDHSFIIGRDVALSIAEEWIAHLIYTTQHKSRLDKSCYNIGFASNEYHHALWNSKAKKNKQNFKMDNDNVWIGYQYQVCGFKNKTGWLYNDENNNIIFEITPYFNHSTQNKKSYPQWIKHYKSLFKWIVSQDTALEWTERMKTLLFKIRLNSKLDLDYDFMTNRKR